MYEKLKPFFKFHDIRRGLASPAAQPLEYLYHQRAGRRTDFDDTKGAPERNPQSIHSGERWVAAMMLRNGREVRSLRLVCSKEAALAT